MDSNILLLKMIQGSKVLGAVMGMHHVTRIILGVRDNIKYFWLRYGEVILYLDIPY